MVHYEDSRKRTPLHLSTCQGYEAVSQTLCGHAAAIDAVDENGRWWLGERPADRRQA